MSTWAILRCRNEIDVISQTLRHTAEHVDYMLVADNASDDGTRDVLADLARDLPMTLEDDPERAYYQGAAMSAMAERAAAAGAEWIVPVDSDEIWYPAAGGRIADVLAQLPPGVGVARAGLFNHFATALDDPAEADPMRRIQWRQFQVSPLPKVAFRWEPDARVHQGNHGVDLPSAPVVEDVLEIRHFPYRSEQQMAAKIAQGAAAYRLTDLPMTEGAHWRGMGQIMDQDGPEAIHDVFREHYLYATPEESGMVHDPAPLAYS
jgi:hypothetical protein